MKQTRWILSAVVCLIMATTVLGQDPRGTITGRVVDATDAVIPGADVTATNDATGVSLTATSNEVGNFVLPFIPSGFYRISVESPGFKKYVRDRVQVRISEQTEITVQLTLGEVTETIEVSDTTPLLDTSTASLGQVIDEKRIMELPMLAGNPTELALLTPGVINGTNMRLRKPAFNNGLSQFTTDGNDRYNNEFQIDGISNTFAEGRQPRARVAFSPPATAVKEFKMQTSTYDASLGHTIGSVVNVSTKSGTNDLHGEAHYWLRHSALDAPNFFNNKRGTAPPVYQDHRYGASAGGPVLLPKVYNGKNKTFWYFAWEANKWGVPKAWTQTVPTPAQKLGDFSGLLGVGSRYQIYDPMSTRVSDKPGRLERDPIPGNIIPQSRLDPVAQAVMNFYPDPTSTGTKDGRNNLFVADKSLEDYYVLLGRVDHTFSQNHRLFVRVHYDWWEEDKNHRFGQGNIADGIILNRVNRGIALDDVLVLDPSLVFNFRYGFTSQDFLEERHSAGYDYSSLGFSQNLISLLPDAGAAPLPHMRVGSYSRISRWESGDGGNNSLTHSFVGAFTKTKKNHNLKFGTDFRAYRAFGKRIPQGIAPDLQWYNTYTRGPFDNSPGAPMGQELAAMLLGVPGGRMQRTATSAMQDLFLGVYIHDDWKVTRNLTINVGLRYEKEWGMTERFNRLVADYDYNTPNPIEAQAQANYAENPIPEIAPEDFRVLGGLTWVDTGGLSRTPFNGESNNIMPRIGFAYRLGTKTTVRGGYGWFFDSIGVNKTVARQTGFSQTTPVQASLDSGLTYIADNADPFPTGLLDPAGPSGGLTTNLAQGLNIYDWQRKHPYSQRWSFGVQRVLPAEFLVEVSYVGNRGTRLNIDRPINNTPAQYYSTSPTRDQETIDYLTQKFPNPFKGTDPIFGSTMSREALLRPYPHFGGITYQDQAPVGYSWYHSLQSKVERRFANGLSFQLAYTWAKLMEATSYMNASDPLPYESLGAMDRPHRIAASFLWEIPVGRGRRYGSDMHKVPEFIVGGWQVGGVLIYQSGAALGFGNAIFDGDINDIALPADERDVDRWFNTEAGFNRNSKQQLSKNLRRFPYRFGHIRSDSHERWDFSLIKTFRINERLNFQFRAEVYNALNRTSFSGPRTSPTSSSFGRITSTQVDARNWQLALRFNF